MTAKSSLKNKSAQVQAEFRQRALFLLTNPDEKGRKRSQANVARILQVHPKTVEGWWKRYQATEAADPEKRLLEASANKRRGPKKETIESRFLLNKEQQDELQDLIVNQVPKDFKIDRCLWTRNSIRRVIKDKFKVEISLSGVGLYLDRFNMTFQRPKKCAIQRNRKKLDEWLTKTYPAIVKRAKKERALIFWEDETCIHQDTNWIGGWSPCGETPVVYRDNRARYGGYSMIGAISNKGALSFSIQEEAYNSQTFVEFLKKLMSDNKDRKLFVICDNVKFHHSKFVTEWLAGNKTIELFFLPAYCPDYNPIEFLNQILKIDLRQRAAMTHKESKKATEDKLKEMQADPKSVQACFGSVTCQYASAQAEVALTDAEANVRSVKQEQCDTKGSDDVPVGGQQNNVDGGRKAETSARSKVRVFAGGQTESKPDESAPESCEGQRLVENSDAVSGRGLGKTTQEQGKRRVSNAQKVVAKIRHKAG